MIKVEHMIMSNMKAAVRGMRNPLNSWEKSDSEVQAILGSSYKVGPNDLSLMNRLYNAGPEHRKFMRQIFVTMDVTAPLYWWKEFDQYKVGVTTDSCSTMHTITAKEFVWDDFSWEHLGVHVPDEDGEDNYLNLWADRTARVILGDLNQARAMYLREDDPKIKKQFWWQIIQLLPSSYNQKRTVSMSYENAANMIRQRTGHKLDEWNTFVDILRTLPYMEEIIKPREKDGS